MTDAKWRLEWCGAGKNRRLVDRILQWMTMILTLILMLTRLPYARARTHALNIQATM